MILHLTSHQLHETLDLGHRIGLLCKAGDLIALDGELGAGKTQFVRGLARGLRLESAAVSSPTFVIMHEYVLEATGADDLVPVPLVHLDAYRITGPEDLATVGFDDELRDQAVTVVEWASRLEAHLGPDRLHILMEHAGDDTRRITLTPLGAWLDRATQLQALLQP